MIVGQFKIKNMKTKVYLFAIGLFLTISTNAQKGVDNGTQYGSGEDSTRCITNISLFIPYAKSDNFKDAYPFWKKVYDECPASTKNVYIYGVEIINWKMSQEKDPAKKEALIDDLMQLYDNRVKYFGNDKRYGKDWIVARKAQSYNRLKGKETDPAVIYKWTGEVIEEFKEKTEPLAISLYMFASFKLMKSDMDKYKEQYVQDFLKCSSILDAQIADLQAANKTKDLEKINVRKSEIESNFASSGAADCETLQSIYASKIEENKDNLEFLKETITLLRRVDCKETEAFFAASEYAYAIEPTAESAMGLGSKALKEKNYALAEKYYTEAINMTDDSGIKADLYYALAAMANQQNRFSKAKSYSLKCLSENPNYGRAYLIIGMSYASSAKGIYPDDPVLTKCVYYAAVDKFYKARNLDPSIAGEASKLINVYSQYFPSKEEIFMHPSINAGSQFRIGGWIGESVKIR